MLRRFYDWLIRISDKPYAVWVLGAMSFAESSIFPVPPDPLLLAMTVAHPKRAWLYALVCTVTSVTGGMVGYLIGMWFYDSIGHWIVVTFGGGDSVEKFRAFYAEWGSMAILVKGLTPIPYKIVTILSGFSGYDFFWFVVLSLITRGARFFIEAGILNYFGDDARHFIERNLTAVAVVFVVTLVGGFLVLRYMF
ncbi:YqaA family protein [Labrys wisconsinensis]|uniref:Membrane protein YqaA with SNARE-associated domain n=1 Tax=Labrys wisconsinensis TaxID=425677 RepID=A0ABU0J1T8_9HYPH|nr:YqaA family protein [Labrys wisconsinensis]MDQ0468218.1 membrane protein YqaA with SNARE-associated domain [Labrys wisconsinensis]